MVELSLFLLDEHSTVELGQKLGAKLTRKGAVLFLTGTLGAGKTTLTRGLLMAFGHAGAVKSPTYTLVEPYSLPKGVAYHFDLYRLADPEELEYLGIRDYFDGDALCVVEWPSRGEGVLPLPDLQIAMAPHMQGTMLGRQAVLTAFSPLGQAVLQQLSL